MGLVLWMEWLVVGSEARMQSCHTPHYLFGPSTNHRNCIRVDSVGFLEAGLLNLDNTDSEDVSIRSWPVQYLLKTEGSQ